MLDIPDILEHSDDICNRKRYKYGWYLKQSTMKKQ